ncbi:MAG TPA: hypothetical protein VHZ07_25285 [Bryobacteraceae bacterium]|nr:hypothetical protein [Bryobacteraceae bacterium]
MELQRVGRVNHYVNEAIGNLQLTGGDGVSQARVPHESPGGGE